MVNGEIFYATYPLTVDTNVGVAFGDPTENQAIFLPADFDIIMSEPVPISGGNGKTNTVMLVVARRKT